MTAINITEKQLDILLNGSIVRSETQRANSESYDVANDTARGVDILVNGVQEASYTQSATNSDYDISISGSVSQDAQGNPSSPTYSNWYHICTMSFEDSDSGSQNIDYTIIDGNSNTVATGTVTGTFYGFEKEVLFNETPPLSINFTSTFVEQVNTSIDCISFEGSFTVSGVSQL